MRRGDVVIAGERGTFMVKPGLWLVVQNAISLSALSSVPVCMLSSTDAPAAFRVAISPDDANGLREASLILTDKIVTLRAAAIDEVIGNFGSHLLARVDEALRYWLDL